MISTTRSRLGEWQKLLNSLKPGSVNLDEYLRRFTESATHLPLPESAAEIINTCLAEYSQEQKLNLLKNLADMCPAERYSLTHSNQVIIEFLESEAKKFDHDNLPYDFELVTAKSTPDYHRSLHYMCEKSIVKIKELYITDGVPSSTLSFHIVLSYNTSESNKLFPEIVKPTQKEAKPAVTLPNVKVAVGGGFAVHENNIISFNGKEIVLPRREREVAAAIMIRTSKNLFTNKDYIAVNLVSEKPDNPYTYAVNLVSITRKAFQAQLNKKHDYFPTKRDIGYKFEPEG